MSHVNKVCFFVVHELSHPQEPFREDALLYLWDHEASCSTLLAVVVRDLLPEGQFNSTPFFLFLRLLPPNLQIPLSYFCCVFWTQ